MRIFSTAIALAALLCATSATLTLPVPAAAQAVSEKEAFESAKELGTIEAWEAFLTNFPKGFRADLARAYVRRLGTGQQKPEAPVQATAPAPVPAPQPQPFIQSAPAPAATLPPIHRGPGASPWRNGTYALDEGNASAYAASVESSGLVLTAYCNANQRLTAVLGESRRGVYPQFGQRVAQGLEASRGQYGTPDAMVSVRFSNGSEEIVSGHVMGLTGEVAIGAMQDGQGFHPLGSFATNLMAEQSMTISAAPFSATFQLTNSRQAVCNVLQSCGVNIAGCARHAPQPAVTQSPQAAPPKKVVKKKGCPGGTVFLEGQCVAHAQVKSFCGPGFHRKGSRCVSNATNKPQPKQVQQQQQNAPSAAQFLQGLAGALQQQQQQIQNKKCPPGKVWEVASCVEDD